MKGRLLRSRSSQSFPLLGSHVGFKREKQVDAKVEKQHTRQHYKMKKRLCISLLTWSLSLDRLQNVPIEKVANTSKPQALVQKAEGQRLAERVWNKKIRKKKMTDVEVKCHDMEANSAVRNVYKQVLKRSPFKWLVNRGKKQVFFFFFPKHCWQLSH